MSEAAEQRPEGELAAAHAKRATLATLADASMKSKSRWLHGAHRASGNGGASRLNCGGQAWPVGLRRSNTCGGELRVLASLAIEG